jgi:hypothetical protein
LVPTSFVLRNPVAEGHIEHQLWIVDALVVLGRAARKPDLLLRPGHCSVASRLGRRRFLMCWLRFSRRLSSALLLGVEIDRGSENLASIFLPKLEKLCEVLATWAGGAACAIVVLTNNLRRRDALRTGVETLSLPVIAEKLPAVPGRQGLAGLAATFGFIRQEYSGSR